MTFVEYDESARTLVVTFTSGRVYAYEGVEPCVYEALLAADSKGSYFNAMIRGAFPTRELPGRHGRAW